MRALDPTCGVYSKTISKGVEAQRAYRSNLNRAARNERELTRIETLRAHEDVRLAVQRGLMPMPAWLAEMDAQQEEHRRRMRAGTTHAAARLTPRRARAAEELYVRSVAPVSDELEDMAAKLRSAWCA